MKFSAKPFRCGFLGAMLRYSTLCSYLIGLTLDQFAPRLRYAECGGRCYRLSLGAPLTSLVSLKGKIAKLGNTSGSIAP